MRNALPLLVLLGILGGAACGGSSSSSTPTPEANAQLREYKATLADGTIMYIEVDTAADSTWEGNFESVPLDGAFHEIGNGVFYGTTNNGIVHATCESLDGTTFDLDGQVTSTGGYRLTRSDRPSELLQFSPVTRLFSQTRDVRSFTFQRRRGTLNLASRIDMGGGNYEYQAIVGTQTGKVQFFANGIALVSVSVHGKGQVIGSFAGTTPQNFGTQTVTSSSSATMVGEFDVPNGRLTLSQ